MLWLSHTSPYSTQDDRARLLGMAPNMLYETGDLHSFEAPQENSVI